MAYARKSSKFISIILGLVMAIPLLIFIGPNVAATDTHTWVAAADGTANVAGNWNPASVPTTGDSVVFDGSSVYNCTSWDYAVTLGDFSLLPGYTGKVILHQAIGVHDLIVRSGTLENWASYYSTTISGSLVRYGTGAITAYTLRPIMTGTGEIMNGTLSFMSLVINAGATITATTGFAIYFQTTCYFTVNGRLSVTGASSISDYSPSRTWIGSGGILEGVHLYEAPGTTAYLFFMHNYASHILPAWNGTSDICIQILGGGAIRSLTLSGNLNVPDATILVDSSDANQMTFDTAGYNVSCRVMSVTSGGLLVARGSTITVTGSDYSHESWTTQGGSFTEGTSTVVLTGEYHHCRLATNQKFYNLELTNTSAIMFDQVTTVTNSFEADGYWNGTIETSGQFIVKRGEKQLMAVPSTGTISIANLSFSYAEVPNVVGIGDSIMELPYTHRLSTLLDKTVIWEGHGGETSAQVLARFNTDVIARAPDFVDICVGWNDVDDQTPESIEENLSAMYDLASEAGLRVIAQTITPSSLLNPSQDAVRIAVNDWMELQANGIITVLDMATLMANPLDPSELDAAYDGGDHVHPNLVGAFLMANYTFSEVFEPYLALQTPGISWDATGTGGDVTYTLSGLLNQTAFDLYADGSNIRMIISDENGGFSFSYLNLTGEHHFEIKTSPLMDVISIAYSVIILIFIASVIIGLTGVLLAFGKKK